MTFNQTNHRRGHRRSGTGGAGKIYMIGVKGVGMTMLAQYFSSQGIEVVGSDIAEKFMTDEILKQAGIKVIEKFSKDNLLSEADLIIYSTAYNAENNEEVATAVAGKIKVMSYAEALAEIFNQKYGIAVVGSHGKTTVTAWLGYVLWQAGLSPSVMAGANVPQFNGAALVGSSDYLVIEADEYQNKLKYFQPKAVILNNIDYDHPDFFPIVADYNQVFIEFIKKIPGKGWLVANCDDPFIRKIVQVNCRAKVITYAINEAADYVAYDIKAQAGKQFFKVHLTSNSSPWQGEEDQDDDIAGNELGDFSIQLAGRHNVYNGLAVIAASIELGVDLFKIRKYLSEFAGTARRLQVLGEFRGAIIIDDYAHHPTEIKASLEGLRQKFGPRKLIVVFHPHTYTRTKALLNDFANSFVEADEVIILDIYGSAREKQGGVHSKDLVKKIVETHHGASRHGVSQKSVKYISTLDECEKYLRENISRDEVVVLMGAGDVFRIGEKLVKGK